MITKDSNKLYYTVHLPMKGKTSEEISAALDYADAELKKKYLFTCERINTFNPTYKGKPILGLANSLSCMDSADICVFMSGWESTNGCVIEHEVARNYGKAILYLK